MGQSRVSKRRVYLGPSDAQANAEALARRGLPYSAASQASYVVSWDWHRRAPETLRDAVHMIQRAYADEVPAKLHDGPDAIGDDGTPRMTAQAQGYIFGRPDADDSQRGEQPLTAYYLTPFRATMARLERSDEVSRRDARIVQHITFGGMRPVEAAMAEGTHRLDAKRVVFAVLCSFLSSMTDLKLNVSQETLTA
jgi:hypothetical protein